MSLESRMDWWFSPAKIQGGWMTNTIFDAILRFMVVKWVKAIVSGINPSKGPNNAQSMRHIVFDSAYRLIRCATYISRIGRTYDHHVESSICYSTNARFDLFWMATLEMGKLLHPLDIEEWPVDRKKESRSRAWPRYYKVIVHGGTSFQSDVFHAKMSLMNMNPLTNYYVYTFTLINSKAALRFFPSPLVLEYISQARRHHLQKLSSSPTTPPSSLAYLG